MTHGSHHANAPARLRAGALAAVLLLALLAPAALGHAADDGIRYRMRGLTPAVDGLTVQVLRGLAGQLVLANDTDEVVEVLDDAGEPFLRIGPDGVEGDVASPTWQASDRPFGLGGDDPAAERTDEPTWVELSDEPSWGWYDHRLHQQELVVPPDLVEPTVLESWSVPLRVGGDEVAVEGDTVAGPPLGVVVPRLVTDAALADGARVTLLPGQQPGLLLQVEPDHEALVRGESGEPFLLFGDGEVRVNAASPTWHRIGGGEASPVEVDAEAEPVWTTVSGGQSFGWIEPRAAAPELGDDLPDDQAVLSTWAVPVDVDGEDTTVLGELRWQALAPPTVAGGGVPWLNVALAVAGLAAIAALVVVRRRARATDEPPTRQRART